MNYIELINSFWQFRRAHPISSGEADLYFYFLAQCNSRQWVPEFELPTRIIELDLGISRKCLNDYRNRLMQHGLITYSQGQGRIPPRYSIVGASPPSQPTTAPACSELPPQPTPTRPSSCSEVPPQNIIPTHSSSCSEVPPQNIHAPVPDVSPSALIPLKDNALLMHVLQHHQQWLEVFCMNNHLTPTVLRRHLSLFITQLENDGVTTKTIEDFKHHFSRWFNIQLSNAKNKQHPQSKLDIKRQQSQDYTSAKLADLQQLESEWNNSAAPSGSATATTALSVPGFIDQGIPSEFASYPFK